jgi:hypothetical protein
MAAVRRWLHLDESPVSDESRAELDSLRAEVTEQAAAADTTAERSVTLARYFERVNDRNHLAERLRAAMRGG